MLVTATPVEMERSWAGWASSVHAIRTSKFDILEAATATPAGGADALAEQPIRLRIQPAIWRGPFLSCRVRVICCPDRSRAGKVRTVFGSGSLPSQPSVSSVASCVPIPGARGWWPASRASVSELRQQWRDTRYARFRLLVSRRVLLAGARRIRILTGTNLPGW